MFRWRRPEPGTTQNPTKFMSDKIESVLSENRVFEPSAAFSESSHVKSMEEYEEMFNRSVENPEEWWSEQASALKWQKSWDTVLDWSNAPFAKWFIGGKINAAENCVDRHVAEGRGDKVAIIWEGEPGDKRTVTYAELQKEVCKFANVLKADGIAPGDRVLIYMPMVPEAAVAMLACA